MADHVPVDDNPAYITMKGVGMSNNSAYATTASLQHTDNDYECIVFNQ